MDLGNTLAANADCYCDSEKDYGDCCGPLIDGHKEADTAVSLMRSRYSAYCQQRYDYILQTYSAEQQQHLTLKELADSANETQWLALKVEEEQQQGDKAQVLFSAWYKVDAKYFRLRENSQFERQYGKWRYTVGDILAESGEVHPKRNDNCFCGSGKKFKKCCYLK